MSQLMMGTYNEAGKARSVEMAVDAQGRLLSATGEIAVPEVAVAQAGLTTLATFAVSGWQRAFFQFFVAEQALDQFVISVRATKSAPWSTLYSTSADYETPRGIMVGVSGDLSTLAAGETGDITLDVRGFYELRFEASSAGAAGSVVSVFGGAA